MKRLVSSAKRRIFKPIALIISLMYNENIVGPKIDPWITLVSIYIFLIFLSSGQ